MQLRLSCKPRDAPFLPGLLFRALFYALLPSPNKKNFQKQIDKLSQKYKNKKILIYGAGLLFSVIYDNYDLSKLNIVGILDKKFDVETGNISVKGKEFKAVCFENIKNINRVEIDFDIMLISTFKTLDIKISLAETLFKDYKNIKNIKIKPLVNKDIKEWIEEILC